MDYTEIPLRESLERWVHQDFSFQQTKKVSLKWMDCLGRYSSQNSVHVDKLNFLSIKYFHKFFYQVRNGIFMTTEDESVGWKWFYLDHCIIGIHRSSLKEFSNPHSRIMNLRSSKQSYPNLLHISCRWDVQMCEREQRGTPHSTFQASASLYLLFCQLWRESSHRSPQSSIQKLSPSSSCFHTHDHCDDECWNQSIEATIHFFHKTNLFYHNKVVIFRLLSLQKSMINWGSITFHAKNIGTYFFINFILFLTSTQMASLFDLSTTM